jgi:hypothetical protein
MTPTDRIPSPRRASPARRRRGLLVLGAMAGMGAGAIGALAASVAAAASAPPRSGQAPFALTVSPAPLTLLGQRQTTLRVTNRGSQPIDLQLALTNYALGPDGRPLIGPRVAAKRSARTWILLQPRQLHLNPGQIGSVHLLAVPPQLATPGDHQAIVLVTATQPGPGRLLVRHRIGVGVLVRVPGPIRRGLSIGRVTTRHVGRQDVLRVRVKNLGNVNERLGKGQVTVQLRRGRRTIAVFRSLPRSLLPGTSGDLVASRVGHRVGVFTAVVQVRFTRPPLAGPGVSSTPKPIVRKTAVHFARTASPGRPAGRHRRGK